MGQQQSKDELLYQQVSCGNTEGIKDLRSQGAGLEWVDNEGKTPLIVACMIPELYNVAKTLIDLGANVNAYRPGRHAGTPLHHAVKRGLEQTVKLLLANGANPLVMNDDCHTPLDIARAKRYCNIVRAIEGHTCLFSGWLREFYGPGFLELLAPQLLSRKVWVVVLPCGSRNLRKPFKLELAIYAGAQDSQPRTIIPLWKANLEEPNFNLPDPAAVIAIFSRIPRRWRRRRAIKSSQEARRTRIKLAPVNENEKQQLQQFCNACKGIPQVVHPAFHFNNQVPTAPETAQQTSENDETDTSTGSSSPTYSSGNDENHNSVPFAHHEASRKTCEVPEAGPSGTSPQHFAIQNSSPSVVQTTVENPSIPSAPPITDASVDDGPINYPSIDMSPIYLSSPSVETTLSSADVKKGNSSDSSSCTICLDAPLEGACIPCGHMAGCMSCLNEIKAKKWGCPVCRSKINQVVRIYAV